MALIKKGQILNPKGNPNIGEISKKHSTGPRTLDGKLKVLLSSGLLKHGGTSKLLKKIRKCKICPLGAKTDEIIINSKVVTKSIPAKCRFYMAEETNGGKRCVIPTMQFITEAKIYYDITQNLDAIELQKALIHQSISDTIINRQHEMLKDGRPGFYTKEFQEQALKYNTEIIKIQHGAEKHQHVHLAGDTADKMIKAMFGKDDKEEDIVEVDEE